MQVNTRTVPDAELDAAVAQYRAEGWAFLPGVATTDTLALLRDRVDAYVTGALPDPGLFFQPDGDTGRYDDVPRVYGWQGPGRAYRKIEKLERDPLYRAWLANPVFERIVGRVMPPVDGAPGAATLYRAVLFTKQPRLGSDTPWHQDGGRFWGLSRDPELQLWTALDDAPPAAGCIEVVPRSHLGGLASPLGGLVPTAQLDSANADTHAVAIPARAGDVLLLHPLLWHRAGANVTDATRRAFTACYLSADTRCLRKRHAPRQFERVFPREQGPSR